MKSAFTSLLRATAFLIIGGFIGFWLSDTIKDARLMFSAASTQSSASAAWKDFAQRIEAVGNRILEDDFANTTDRDRGGYSSISACNCRWSTLGIRQCQPGIYRVIS